MHFTFSVQLLDLCVKFENVCKQLKKAANQGLVRRQCISEMSS